jgi:hypothetical protein
MWLSPVASENPIQIDSRSAAESEHHLRMIALGLLFLCLLCDRFKPRRQLEAEILVLRLSSIFCTARVRSTAFAVGRSRSVHLALSSLSSHS